MGVDPAMFSQALMFHAHRYSKGAWAGEPETDPTQDIDEPVEGWELTPQECIDLAYGGVLREKSVIAGTLYDTLFASQFCLHRLQDQVQLVSLIYTRLQVF
jgi:hypothetical protein